MNELQQWAIRNGVRPSALTELTAILSQIPQPPKNPKPLTEAATQQQIRLAAPKWGITLWRNNVGVFETPRGVPVRYGLANDSPKVNKRTKSSDSIGFVPMLVGPQHMGRMVALFTAIECKRHDWKWAGSAREVAQQRFLNIVKAGGGIAGFARNADEFFGIVAGGVE